MGEVTIPVSGPGNLTSSSLASLTSATSYKTYQSASFAANVNVPVTIANYSGGPGIISRIWFTTASLGIYNQSYIQVYVDGESSPSLILDVGCMPGTVLVFELPAGAITGATQNLEFGMNTSGNQGAISWNFLYPIPFSSSVVLKYVEMSNNTGGGLYMNVEIQQGVSSPRRLRNTGALQPYNVLPTYNGATAYTQGAMVLSSGVNYVAVQATTGNAPPNATYWTVVNTPTGSVNGPQLGNGSVVLAYVPNTPVWVAGMGVNFASANASWMENSPMIFDIPTNNSPAVGTSNFQSTGFEDICGSSFYFMSHMTYLGGLRHPGGTTRGTATVTASPFTLQNLNQGAITAVVTGGVVTLIELSRDGSTFDTIATSSPISIYLAIGDRIRITYSVAPTVAMYPVLGATSSPNSKSLIISQAWDQNNTQSPQYGGIFKDWLAQSGGIRCQNGLLMRFEAPTGKGTNGNSTSLGWNILYYI